MLNLTNELTILKQVKHKNIVMLVDKWRTEEHYYLLLEYSNGGDLKKMMKK
jgi:serine/threonine protein kinase